MDTENYLGREVIVTNILKSLKNGGESFTTNGKITAVSLTQFYIETENFDSWFDRADFELVKHSTTNTDAFSFTDVLKRLTNATDYLLKVKNYDGSDYEELELCIAKAYEMISKMEIVHKDVQIGFEIDNKTYSRGYSIKELLNMNEEKVFEDMEVCGCYPTEYSYMCECNPMYADSEITGYTILV